jgi:beta-mannosidase
LAVELEPLATTRVDTQTFDLSAEQRRGTVFLAELFQNDHLITRTMVPFVPNKHLELVDPQMTVTCNRNKKSLEIRVNSNNLARFVELKINERDVIFSDNYFDVLPGHEVVITAPVPVGMSINQIKKALVAKSLYHSFR